MLAIYARVSQEEQSNNSIDTQVALGIEYAKESSLNYKLFIDNGISGTWEIEKRPALLELINDITSGNITHIFAYDQSRLERDNKVWSNLYLLFQSTKIKLYFYDSGDFDFSKDENFLVSNILSVFNSFYVKLTKRKVKTALLENIKKGKVHSISPYGYTKDKNGLLVVKEEESETIKLIYQLSLSGVGTNKIAEILNEKAIPTKYNSLDGEYKYQNKYTNSVTIRNKKDAKWAGKTIQGIIKNTIYKGERYWQDNYYKAPAIIEVEYWQEVNDNLKKNRNNSGKTVTHKYLLKGKLTCARCERNYYGRSRLDKRDHVYMCSSKRIKGQSCGNGGINIDRLEKVIWSHFFINKELLNLINSGTSSKEERLVANKSQIAINNTKNEALNSEKNRLIQSISKGIITDSEAQKEMDRIRKRLAELEKERSILLGDATLIMSAKELAIESTAEFSNFSNNLTFSEKKNIISKYIKRIYLNLSDVKTRTFAMQIDFNFGIESEKYFLIKDAILSLNQKKFFQLEGPLLIEKLTLDDFSESILNTNLGRVAKPWINYNNTVIPISNPYYPFGLPQDWNLDSLEEFYQVNPEWLSPITGTNTYCINENEQNYNWFVQNYKLYKNRPLREWFQYLLSFDLKVEEEIIRPGIAIHC